MPFSFLFLDGVSVFFMGCCMDMVDTAIKQAGDKFIPLGNAVANELKLRTDTKLFFVGGSVRDSVLNALFSKQYDSKDIDVILSKKQDFGHNPNITFMRRNSLGGVKLRTRNFGTIDVFQYYVDNPCFIVSDIFDFNCNAIYYSHNEKCIIATPHFYNFILNKTLDLEKVIYVPNGIEYRYDVAALTSRALKFQIEFRERYDLNLRLSENILYMIYNLDKTKEQQMIEYTKSKAGSIDLQNKILSEYQKLR